MISPTEKFAVLAFMLIFGGLICLEVAVVTSFLWNLVRGRGVDRFTNAPSFWVINFLAVGALLCLFYARFVEPKSIEQTNIILESPQVSEPLRIVHISDLHCNFKPLNEKALVEIVNSLKPDLIFFTGDAINYDEALGLFSHTMSSMKAVLGKYACLGNHDLIHLTPEKLFRDTGFQLLDNNSVTIKFKSRPIHITGINPDSKNIYREILAAVPADGLNILLRHYSDIVEDLEGLNVDLYLSGHTHGGQVSLPFYGALITLSDFGKKYESGLYKVNGTALYVNRGIGMEAPPAPQVRFNAPPEVTLIEILPERIDPAEVFKQQK